MRIGEKAQEVLRDGGVTGAAAGTVGKGYYSYEVGEWHVVVVNSEIIVNTVFGEAARKEQMDWVEKDLKAHKTPEIASRTSASVGCGFSSSSACAAASCGGPSVSRQTRRRRSIP